MNEITSTRANALIDPTLSIWHVEIPVYLFLGGVVAGIMVLVGYWLLKHPNESERSRAMSLLPWAAPVLLSVGMLFLWLDLENRWNVVRFYLTLRVTSPMSWGSWILLAIYPISILTAWVTTPEPMRVRVLRRLTWRPAAFVADCAIKRSRRLAIASMIGGAGLGVYTGILLGTLAARPLWNSALLGPLFLTSGISTGAAFLLLSKLNAAERTSLARMDMFAIVVEMMLIALWLIGLLSGEAAARSAALELLSGPYAAAFWTMVVALGLVTPLLAEWVEQRHQAVPGRVAAVLVLVGGFALRWILVYAGQHGVTSVALH